MLRLVWCWSGRRDKVGDRQLLSGEALPSLSAAAHGVCLLWYVCAFMLLASCFRRFVRQSNRRIGQEITAGFLFILVVDFSRFDPPPPRRRLFVLQRVLVQRGPLS